MAAGEGRQPFFASIAAFDKSQLKHTATTERHLDYGLIAEFESVGWRSFTDFQIFGAAAPAEDKDNDKEKEKDKADAASRVAQDTAFSARFVAAARAMESERPSPLFRDAFARFLAGEDAVEHLQRVSQLEADSSTEQKEGGGEQEVKEQPYWSKDRPYLLIRTKFFDDGVTEALAASPTIKQVVILGAGMDSRAQRLPWHADTTVFEFDRQDVVQWKVARLAAMPATLQQQKAQQAVSVKYLSADLTAEWVPALHAAGFEQAAPSLWIVEGLLYYLSPSQVERLLSEIAELACPGSLLITDVVNSKEQQAVSFRSSMDFPEHQLAAHGFHAQLVVQPGDAAANYGRFTRPFPPRSLPLDPASLPATAPSIDADIRRVYLIRAAKLP